MKRENIMKKIYQKKKKIIDIEDEEILEYKPKQQKSIISNLTGEELNITDFITSNTISKNKNVESHNKTWAIPFTRKNTQNMKENSYSNKLGIFTGKQEFKFHKKETSNFFKPTKDLTFVNGKPNTLDKVKDRYVKSNNRRNELPFESETVGRGIGQNYGNKGKGGFHQFEINDIIKPKNVDELRAISKPKITYKQPIIKGKDSIDKRGAVPNLKRYKPTKTFINKPSRYLKTTGAYLKQKQNPEILLKTTSRTISGEVHGAAAPVTNINPKYRNSKIKKSIRNVYKNSGRRNLSNNNKWSAIEYEQSNEEHFQSDINSNINDNLRVKINKMTDYGKSGVNLPPNERDTTQKRTHIANITSAIKSIIAPINDMIKKTKKENTEVNSNRVGYFGANIPKKQTVYDPNDIARTTIKETTEVNDHDGNLSSIKKQTVYDPDDIAKTTIKETTEVNNHDGNLSSIKKQTVYDPDDIAKTTIKETTEVNDHDGNLSSIKKQTVYDPNDIARTTIKETTLNAIKNAAIKGAIKLTVYDPNDILRTTIKETNIHNTRKGNIGIGSFKKATNYNILPPKRTLKETTIDNKHISNVAFNRGGGKGYLSSNYFAPATIKQDISNKEYGGNISSAHNNKGGYLSNKFEAPATIKQFTSDNEYTGAANSSSKAISSYSSAYNSRTNSTKEQISKGRAPTNNSVKIAGGRDRINTINKKQNTNINYQNSQNYAVVNQNISSVDMQNFTTQKNPLSSKGNDERINPYNLSQLDNNPYHLSINRNIVDEIENFVSEISGSESEAEDDEIEQFITEISDMSDDETI
jgi:hypothetical protein